MPDLAQRVISLVGPTASGKTALAVALAGRLLGEIFSVDSRQVYRGMDLGTGKDLAFYGQGEKRIPVHLLDIADPRQPYSLFQYQRTAFEALSHWRASRGPWHPALLCGGTGLYLEAVLRKYQIANVPENPRLREALMARPQAELWRELQDLDPEWASRTDGTSKKRIVRALEVARQRQMGPVALSETPTWGFDSLVFVVQVAKETLRRNIAGRLGERMGQGLVEEVEGLLRDGLPLARLQQLGLEYREIGEYLSGYRSREEMLARLQAAIEDFAKRQTTWFRGLEKRHLPAVFLPEGAGVDFLAEAIGRKWPDVAHRFFQSQPPKSRFALAAVLDEKGRVLLLRRSPSDAFAPGLWGLPGGHLQPGENPRQALERECAEELGSDFQGEIQGLLPPVRDSHYGGQFEVFLAKVKHAGGRPRLNEEHSDFAWVGPEDYAGYPVVPGVDEDLAYLQVWPRQALRQENLPPFLRAAT